MRKGILVQKFIAFWMAIMRVQKRSIAARMSSALFVQVNGVLVMNSLMAASSPNYARRSLLSGNFVDGLA
jgi:hypothetical protein